MICFRPVCIYDRDLDVTNWSLLPGDTSPVLSLPSEGEFSRVGISLEPEQSLVPLTVGPSNRPSAEVSVRGGGGGGGGGEHRCGVVGLQDQLALETRDIQG